MKNQCYFAVYDKEDTYNEGECLTSFDDEDEAMDFVNTENAGYGYNKLYYKMEYYIKKVNKEHYHIHLFTGGYYGICEKSSGGNCVFGGDSANEDDYNEDYITEIYNRWDGTLHYTGDRYGYRIEI